MLKALGETDTDLAGLEPMTFGEALTLAVTDAAQRARWGRVATLLGKLEAERVRVSIASVTTDPVMEGATLTFTLRADAAPAADLRVAVTVEDTQARAGSQGASDFVADGVMEVVIRAGRTQASFTVATVDDGENEPGGFVSARVNGGLDYAPGSPWGASAQVLDDDAPGEAGLASVTISGGAGVTEGGSAVFTLTAAPPPASSLTVSVVVTQTGDFAASGQAGLRRVTIGTGGTATFTVATEDDGADEADGAVRATVVSGAGYAARPRASANVAVADNDATPPPSGTTFVPDASLVADIRRWRGETRHGQAHVDRWTRVLIALGAETGSFEPMPSSEAQGYADRGWTRWAPVVAELRRKEAHDAGRPPQPRVTVAASSAGPVTEGAPVTFTLGADKAPAADLAVRYTVADAAGADFVAREDEGAKTVVIPAGRTSVEIVVATVADAADEPDGQVTLTLAAGAGYALGDAASASVAVSDDDATAGPTLSISDVTGAEGANLPFTITLSAPAAERVCFDARTRDSTPRSATAGRDYTPNLWNASRFLPCFRPGQTTLRLWIKTWNDAHDDPDETFEMVLSNPRGATIADAVGVGTITNSDPLPAAWLARFGRTVAGQAVDAVTARMAPPRASGLVGEIGGEDIVLKPSASPSRGAGPARDADRRAGPGGSAAGAHDETRRALAAVARAFDGTGGGSGDRETMNGASGGFGDAPSGTGTGPGSRRSRGMGGTDFLLETSLALTGVRDPDHGGSLAFWGRAARGSFEGREGALDLDGEVTTALLGADYARDDWLAGVALTRSAGKGGYAHAAAGAAGGGDVAASLTAAIPYAAVQASERLGLWGALGHGAGEVTLATGLGETLRADIGWTMAAAGMRADLLETPKEGPGPSLALTSDALWARTTSDGTRALAASASDVTRLRVGLEGGWTFDLEDGGSLTPGLEAGVRHDGGDAETGAGLELGGGIRWTDPGRGLSLDLGGRTLLAHGTAGLEDRGFSGGVTFDPDPASERGPSFSLRHDRGGRAQGGLDALFADAPLDMENRTGPDGGDPAGRWTLEGAWGLPVPGGRFTGSPHMGLGLAPDGRDMRLGWRLTPAGPVAPDLSFELAASRRETGSDAPEHGLGVEWGTTGKRALNWRMTAARRTRGGAGPETVIGLGFGLRW